MPSNPPPRYYPQRAFPPYSYVPGLFPHPTSDERGHSFCRKEPPPQSLAEASYRDNATYRYAIDLFNHGFYWEAHEEWESLWHAAGRQGAIADFLKGLIKLAAAGVKAREGRAAGVRQHAERAAELFRSVQANGGGEAMFGLSLTNLIAAAATVANRADELAGDSKPEAKRRLPVEILPENV